MLRPLGGSWDFLLCGLKSVSIQRPCSGCLEVNERVASESAMHSSGCVSLGRDSQF